MKQVKFLLLAAFVAMFTGCQNEEDNGTGF